MSGAWEGSCLPWPARVYLVIICLLAGRLKARLQNRSLLATSKQRTLSASEANLHLSMLLAAFLEGLDVQQCHHCALP